MKFFSSYVNEIIINFMFFFRVLYDELLETTKTYIKNLVEITPSLLLEVAPHYFSTPTL